jgi:hypothetical protein
MSASTPLDKFSGELGGSAPLRGGESLLHAAEDVENDVVARFVLFTMI